MSAIRPVHVFVLGLLLLLGSAWPLGLAWQELATPRPVSVLADGPEAHDVAVALEPARRARVALTLALEPGAEGAYQVPVSVRVRTADGAEVVDVDAFVTPPNKPAAGNGLPPQLSVFEYPEDGDGKRLGVLFRAFEVPAAGELAVSVRLDPDSRYGAHVTSARWRLEHDLGMPISALACGVFMLFAGIVAATAGAVRYVAGRDAAQGTEATPVAGDTGLEDARRHAMGCHLAGLLGFVVPFGNVLGPLACWLAWRHRHAYVEEQAREALNFQLTIVVYVLLTLALALALLGLVLLPVVLGLQLVLSLLAARRARRGEAWRYPVTIRFA